MNSLAVGHEVLQASGRTFPWWCPNTPRTHTKAYLGLAQRAIKKAKQPPNRLPKYPNNEFTHGKKNLPSIHPSKSKLL
jgi:hypothetical protein